VDTRMKGVNDPVTAADHAANDVICAALRDAFPGDALLSEESRDSGERLSAERVWIIDPLDGTKEFLAANGEFCVMIGLAVAGSPVLGVVYAPATDTLDRAATGQGAFREHGGVTTRLACVPADPDRIRLVGSRSHPSETLVAACAALGIDDVLPSGSVGIKCGLIAEGARDLYLHPVPYLKEWDTCAPELVLREAGGWVSDCFGQPLRYNKPAVRQPAGILAATPGLHSLVLDRTAELFRTAGLAA